MTSLTTVRVHYQTIEIGNTDVCTLRDNQQFSDPDDEALNLGICSASWPMFEGDMAIKLGAGQSHA
ncbi:hypothetical protein PKHYL_08410 [Psychrobacter sp. KH172YL61]|uniref:hypothetical protein n=1 Tax=Psychrobacter sp. KH172YL61 TaxID=2517899 RepID=UPI0010BA4588|nr:hypothetical protein [Psychrobacter sp. KH172YL61]BBI66650.1 hypothetical protein PKHYL_08410 [Psychrobacter sp. KH172YL61]